DDAVWGHCASCTRSSVGEEGGGFVESDRGAVILGQRIDETLHGEPRRCVESFKWPIGDGEASMRASIGEQKTPPRRTGEQWRATENQWLAPGRGRDGRLPCR